VNTDPQVSGYGTGSLTQFGEARLHPYVGQKKWGHTAVRYSIVAANRAV
jgi:hypothetical protein